MSQNNSATPAGDGVIVPARREPSMTAADRNQLMVVANERAKLAKDAVRVAAADRLVELNRQLEAEWEVQDFAADEERRELNRIAKEINVRIRAKLDELGVLRELQPSMSVHFNSGWVSKDRRGQLRQMLKDANDADVKRAHHTIDTWRTDTRERLVRQGLTSDAAIEFLDTLPAAGELLSELDVKSLQLKALESKR
jgi:hypothetical protein